MHKQARDDTSLASTVFCQVTKKLRSQSTTAEPLPGCSDKAMRGGFTFKLSHRWWRPNIQIRHLNARASLKRYVLFNLGDAGEIIIRKASAHALGQYLTPYEAVDAPCIPAPCVELSAIAVERWQYDLWRLPSF